MNEKQVLPVQLYNACEICKMKDGKYSLYTVYLKSQFQNS